MSRRFEDLDEFCDPNNPRAIQFEDILEAADKLRPYMQYTSCLPSHYQEHFTMYLHHKLEIFHNTGSFKERGILNALLNLTLDKKKIGAIVASNGNEALSFTYYAAKLNIPAFVVLTQNVATSLIQKCHSRGAKVFVLGHSLAESTKFARAMARDKNLAYINGRDHPHVLAGYGTIGLEILEQLPSVDAIIVPVGTGGLVAAVATAVKQIKPKCFVYGVQPEASPTFFHALVDETPKTMSSTLADSIDVTAVGTNAIFNARPLVDKMLLVKETWIARAMLHYYEKERLVAEGAAACPLAAILGNIVPELKLKCVACIVSGGNVSPLIYIRSIERSLAAEGSLVKFRVTIHDGTQGILQLHRLLGAAGCNVIDMVPDKVNMNDDLFNMKVRLVCETRGMNHSLELKRIIERAYPFQTVFKNEPFNDNRGCPCYIRKHITYF